MNNKLMWQALLLFFVASLFPANLALAGQPEIFLSLEKSVYQSQTQQTLNISIAGDQVVDAYVALVNSDGAFLCLTPALSFAEQNLPLPVVSNWPIVPGVYPLTLDLPTLTSGKYSWIAILCTPGYSPMETGNWLASHTVDFSIGASELPTVALSVDKESFSAADTQTIGITITGGDVADIYLALDNSAGNFKCLKYNNEFSSQNEIQAILNSWKIENGTYSLKVPLTGLTDGAYNWELVITRPGQSPYEQQNWMAHGTATFNIITIIATPTPTPTPSPGSAPTPTPTPTTTGAPTHIPEIVHIAGGTFLMGSTDSDSDALANEKPQHSVTISSFSLGKYEITNEEFCEFINDGNYQYYNAKMSIEVSYDEDTVYTPTTGTEKMPANYVSWEGARQYCSWLSARTGKTYRLPTEAEWEFACRAGATSAYSWGDAVDATKANYGNAAPAQIGSYPVNAWGLYEMTGNLQEWCEDIFAEDYYASSPDTDPQGPSSGANRVLRGGAWNLAASYLRSAARNSDQADLAQDNTGFRCVLDETTYPAPSPQFGNSNGDPFPLGGVFFGGQIYTCDKYNTQRIATATFEYFDGSAWQLIGTDNGTVSDIYDRNNVRAVYWNPKATSLSDAYLKVTYTDYEGRTTSAQKQIQIAPEPVFNIALTEYDLASGTFVFDASESYHVLGASAVYSWSFDGGTPIQGLSVTHNYGLINPDDLGVEVTAGLIYNFSTVKTFNAILSFSPVLLETVAVHERVRLLIQHRRVRDCYERYRAMSGLDAETQAAVDKLKSALDELYDAFRNGLYADPPDVDRARTNINSARAKIKEVAELFASKGLPAECIELLKTTYIELTMLDGTLWLSQNTSSSLEGPTITRGGNRTGFTPSQDEVGVRDGDTFNDHVLYHELDHVFMYKACPKPMPGGQHIFNRNNDTGDSDNDTELALVEGWATFSSCAKRGSSVYHDNTNPDTHQYDLETGNFAGRDGSLGTSDDQNSPRGVNRSEKCESTVAGILWDLYDGGSSDDDNVQIDFDKLFKALCPRPKSATEYFNNLKREIEKSGPNDELLNRIRSVYSAHGVTIP